MDKNKPIIGIILDNIEHECDKNRYSEFPWYVLRKNYADAIIKHGGIPIFLPHYHSEEYLSLCDGLLVPGGDYDIHPKFYNEEIKYSSVKPNLLRTDAEFFLVEEALKKEIPFLGICNGMQVLNVIFEGSLLQDINSDITTSINHENRNKHYLTFTEGGALNGIKKGERFIVNSSHHQAIRILGKGLKVYAKAEDDIIEFIKAEGKNFVVGVQWHPEYLETDTLDTALFEDFISASIQHKYGK